jgi:hypothetical protein
VNWLSPYAPTPEFAALLMAGELLILEAIWRML